MKNQIKIIVENHDPIITDEDTISTIEKLMQIKHEKTVDVVKVTHSKDSSLFHVVFKMQWMEKADHVFTEYIEVKKVDAEKEESKIIDISNIKDFNDMIKIQNKVLRHRLDLGKNPTAEFASSIKDDLLEIRRFNSEGFAELDPMLQRHVRTYARDIRGLLLQVANLTGTDYVPLHKFERSHGVTSTTCARCDGKGVLPQFHYVEGGVCFKCKGSGE